jgi:Calcineurin-like phosphoesterase
MTQAIDVVIGDVHARADALYSLLREVGVIDARGRRRRAGWVMQVGDLLDRNATREANLETAHLAADSLDVVLVGNHEWRLITESEGEHGAALATLAGQGWPHAAAACDGWLLTHAGVHPRFAADLPPDAAACAEEIDHRWHSANGQRARDPLFAAVGPARGGDDPHGSIFWMHSSEWPKNEKTPWGQIAGHVPQPEPRLLPGPRWAIDIKAPDRLAALVRPQGERRWRPVVVKARAHRNRPTPAVAA